MSSSTDSNSTLRTFLKNSSTLVLTAISFISSIYGFVKLFGDKDAGLVTLISLMVGILLLLVICLYYARFWQPEKQDKGRSSAFESPLSDQQVKAQIKKEQRRKLIRRLAVAGLFLVPILSVSSFAGWQYFQNLPTSDNIILVADFDSPDAKNYGVTETVINQLRQAAVKYPDVKIQALNKPITEQEGSEVARSEGKKRKATIVIWGWYRNTGEVVPLSVHFEVLHPPKELPNLGESAKGQVQQAAIAELKSFTLQTRLSTELTSLSLLTLGVTRFTIADWDGAIARLSDALSQSMIPSSKIDPGLIYFYRGTVYEQKGDFDRAFTDLNQAIKLHPNFAEAYSNRLLIYVARGDYNPALEDANQSLKLKPDFALAYNNRGMIYLNKSDFDHAISDFNQALKFNSNSDVLPDRSRSQSNPIIVFNDDRQTTIFNGFVAEVDNALLYLNRGSAYLAKGDFDHALADINQAIHLQPDFALAYFNRGSVYWNQGNYDRALADLNQGIQLQPNFALAYIKRGDVYYKKGDYDHALADLDYAIQLQPHLAVAYGTRGEIYRHQGNFDRALTDFNQALQLMPNDALLYYDRAITYYQKRNYGSAIADYTQAIKLQPDNAEFFNNRGDIYQVKGDYDRAIADFNQALKLKPNYASAYNNRGYTYAKQGSYDQALMDANRAIQLQSNKAAFYDTRGFAYAGKDEYDRALADYNQALKLEPNADYAYYHRGLVHQKRGERDQAIADFRRTLELTQDPKRHQEAETQLLQNDN